MVALVDRKARSPRGSARRKRGLYEYGVTVLTTKKLKWLSRQAEGLSLSGFREMFGEDALVVPKPRNAANTDATVDQSAFKPDARARTILRGVEMAEADLADAGGAYSLEQVRRLLHGITRQRVERRIRDGSLLAVPGPSNRRAYPTAQFNSDGSVVEGLSQVQSALGYSSAWSVLNFLVNESDGLNGERPIDALRRGGIDRVVEVARAVGVQGS